MFERNDHLATPLTHLRVLVVAHDCTTRQGIVRSLSQAGVSVDDTNDAGEALKKLESDTYAVAILDDQVLRLSVDDLFACLRRRQPELQGVMVTADATLPTVEAAISAGFRRILLKDGDANELLKVVCEVGAFEYPA